MRFPFINRRITPLLPITIFLFLLLTAILFFLPPGAQVPFAFISLSMLTLVFPLVFLLFFGIGTLLFRSRFNGLLLGLFVVSALLLRLNDLKHPLFLILLAAFFITLEFFFAQTGKKQPHRAQKEQLEQE
jgi:hypothetical protein